ncbi:MAG: DUF4136 domain-containing protein [Bergeyella sp.]|nr:DUF4136 domain-containing protein [Bergeyella sp.]
MKNLMKTLLCTGVFVLLFACSPFQVRSDYARNVNFTAFKTYKLRIDDLELNDIDKDRVLNELSKQLKQKGLAVAENPDLVVNVKASYKKITNVQTLSPWGGYWGWGGHWWGMMGFGMQSTWTNNYNSGTLVVDIIDSKTQKLVWQGIGSGISVDSPSQKRKQIPEIIAEIMAYYPPVRQKTDKK